VSGGAWSRFERHTRLTRGRRCRKARNLQSWNIALYQTLSTVLRRKAIVDRGSLQELSRTNIHLCPAACRIGCGPESSSLVRLAHRLRARFESPPPAATRSERQGEPKPGTVVTTIFLGALLGAFERDWIYIAFFIIGLKRTIESSSGTICSPRHRPATSSKRLVSKQKFIDSRWQPSGLIQRIPAEDIQNVYLHVSAGWPRKTPGTR
jgi:hypothetical protein